MFKVDHLESSIWISGTVYNMALTLYPSGPHHTIVCFPTDQNGITIINNVYGCISGITISRKRKENVYKRSDCCGYSS